MYYSDVGMSSGNSKPLFYQMFTIKYSDFIFMLNLSTCHQQDIQWAPDDNVSVSSQNDLKLQYFDFYIF